MWSIQIAVLNLSLDPNFVQEAPKSVLYKILQLYDNNGQNLRVLKSRYVVKISRLLLTFMCVCVYPYFVQHKDIKTVNSIARFVSVTTVMCTCTSSLREQLMQLIPSPDIGFFMTRCHIEHILKYTESKYCIKQTQCAMRVRQYCSLNL
jgi:hypothetical protein